MINNILDADEAVFGEKLENIEYMDRNAVYGVVINNEGKIGIIKTPTGYFLPGGGIEKGESHIECIKREFMEETGYEVNVERYIGRSSLYHISKIKQYLRGIGNFYLVNLICKTKDKVEEDHEMVWLEPNECIKCLFLQHQAWAVSKVLKF